ncbi:Uncharacterized protein SCO1/SenC/PrrC involved in biogenesis of respiratory and photosynthetic systems-like protein [Methylobacterium sp. 4-46]|uniref:SCO family protein n=1 Tax=unclassified Methylobacterium TaxID=2615210 RepID=UPI000165C873|nr:MULTISPECIES: SCO family protein [Methylobacterium]ACA15046.1 Uncharacterized protein SCO1/SenC/PrrC involved in biogenesis of respiratory and photosynthetic systems-like protein [Methylobacterium sp. 4-46]WFT80784.1 SCO family protein [Methylobacterium nodulans]
MATPRAVRIGALLLGLVALAGSVPAAPGGALGPEGGRPSAIEDLVWPDAPGTRIRRDQSGRPLTPETLRDKVAVVGFVSTQCPITCVVLARELDALAGALPPSLRDRVVIVAVTVDPARDDVAALRRFGEGMGIDPGRVRLVTSDPAATAHQAALLRYPADRLPLPPPRLLVFDRRGDLAMIYGTEPVDRPRLLTDLALLERFEAGIHAPPRPDGAPLPASNP